MSDKRRGSLPVAQVPVGQLLSDELEHRDWTQAEFADVLGRPTQFVSEIVTGKKEITRESAAQIGAALDMSAEFWLKAQDAFHLAEQAQDPRMQRRLDDVRKRALLSSKFPIQLLQKRGVITGRSLEELEAEVLDLFDIPSLEHEPKLAAAAKRSNYGEVATTLQLAWVACVRRAAGNAKMAEFKRSELRKLASTLSQTLRTPAEFVDLPERLAEVGVRLVYVEALPGAKIDGCALFVNGVPVVGLSGRGKRLDKVLFALLHELAHVALEHVDADNLIVENLDDSDASKAHTEQEANDLAAKWCFPDGLAATPRRVSAAWVKETAAEAGVAPIVVIGTLQHQRRLEWRTTLARNAPNVDQVIAGW